MDFNKWYLESDVPGSKIGVYKDGAWYLDWNGNGAWDQGIDRAFNFGAAGWTPVMVTGTRQCQVPR